MAKIEIYEKHADLYDGWFSRNRSAYESELRAVRRSLPRGGRGVEIGVGTGRFASAVGIPFGVEPSKSMRDIAAKRGISVVGGVAEALPFRDGRFDYALMVTALCFFDDVEESLKEAHRILAPSGILVIGFIDRDSPVGKLYEGKKHESLFYRNAAFRSAQEVGDLLKRAGFRTVAFLQTIFSDPGRMRKPDPVREGYGEGCFVVARARK